MAPLTNWISGFYHPLRRAASATHVARAKQLSAAWVAVATGLDVGSSFPPCPAVHAEAHHSPPPRVAPDRDIAWSARRSSALRRLRRLRPPCRSRNMDCALRRRNSRTWPPSRRRPPTPHPARYGTERSPGECSTYSRSKKNRDARKSNKNGYQPACTAGLASTVAGLERHCSSGALAPIALVNRFSQ